MYKIKPLQWVKDGFNNYDDWKTITYSASTQFGRFTVCLESKLEQDGFLDSNGWYRMVHWSYCFDEHYDERYFTCKSIKEGMKLAEEYWRSRIKKDLEEEEL